MPYSSESSLHERKDLTRNSTPNLACVNISLYLYNYINSLEHGRGQKSSGKRRWVRKGELNRMSEILHFIK